MKPTRKGSGLIGMLAIFLAGVAIGGAGVFFYLNKPIPLTPTTSLHEAGNSYELINPLLLCNTNTPKEIAEFKPLNDKIKSYTYDFLNSASNVHAISFYFRDLTSGRWTGINEEEAYDPASLLKVPLIIAYYKEAESDPSILSKKLLYQHQGGPAEVEGTEFHDLVPGNYYTVDELINTMITKSDDDSAGLLLASMDINDLNEIFSDLGITVPQGTDNRYLISAKTYSLFFRILYNATYLSRDYSERALELLAKTQYEEGILAGIPKGTVVADKFGQFGVPNPLNKNGEEWELHDCGIVYKPDHPYLLCAMTKGEDLDTLQTVIQNISRIVYKEVDNNYK